MSDELTTAYLLGAEQMRSKIHKAADEIERLLYENAELREDNKRFYKQAEMNARLLTENASLRAENETLRRDVKTAIMGDSAELQDVKRENEKLLEENDILKDLCKGKWEQIKDVIRESDNGSV